MKHRILALIIAVVMLTACFPTVTVDRPADGSALGIRVSAGTSAEAAKPKPKKVKITGSKYVAKGKKITLKATVTPDGADQKVKWTSSNKKIATVSSKGVVKGKKAGKVKITATSKSNPKAKKTFTVTVKADAVKSVKITSAPATLKIGGTAKLKAAATPKKAAQSFEWTSSDKAVATVSSSGEVKALKKGKATITATATDGSKKKGTAVIEVVSGDEPKVDVESIVINGVDPETPLDWKLEHSETFTATVLPANATNKSVNWVSSDTGVLKTEADGTVTAVGCGTAAVHAEAKDGSGVRSEAFTVNVWSVAIKDLPEYMEIGETAELKADARPDSAPEVEWSVDDDSVAEIIADGNQKKLKALKNGEVTVTAKLSGLNIKATRTVHVVTYVTGISITGAQDENELFAGETLQLGVGVQPDGASNKAVEWISSNPDVVTVSQSGLVTAVGYGEVPATVKAVAKDGSGTESATVSFKVWNVLQGISISNLPTVIDLSDTPDLVYRIEPDENTLKERPTVTWTVTGSGDDPGEAAVEGEDENKKLKPVRTGTVTVSAAVDGTGIKAEKTVTIGKKVTVITVTAAEGEDPLDLLENETIQLVAAVEPEDATNKEVIWSVNNEEVATVDGNGMVTALKKGDVTVTARAADGNGAADSLGLTVNSTVSSIEITGGTELDLSDDQKLTTQLTAAVLPEDAPQDVTWSSDDTGIATVDDNGLVTAVANGTTVIRATSVRVPGKAGFIEITVASDEPEADSWDEYWHSVQYLDDGGVNVTVRGFASGSSLTAICFDSGYNGRPVRKLTIEKDAFKNSAQITRAPRFPNTAVSIGDYAFYMCGNMTGELVLPEGVEIGAAAFYGCGGVSAVRFPRTVSSMGWHAFREMAGLTDLVLPENLATVPGYGFQDDVNIRSITWPGNVAEIEANAFQGCTGLTGDLEIPGTVTEIGYRAFYNCGMTGNLVLHEGLTKINEETFTGNSFTGSLVIPNSVTSVGKSAFENCAGFTGRFSLGTGLTTVGESAFAGCGSFRGSLTIPSSMRTIAYKAFEKLSISGQLIFREGVRTIETSAFAEAGFTGSLTLPDSLTSLGSAAFKDCRGLSGILMVGDSTWTSVNTSSMAGSIVGAFYGCSGIRTAIVPDGNIAIPANTFNGCTSLRKVRLGETVYSIRDNAFKDCANLAEINLEHISDLGGVKSYDGKGLFPFTGCAKLQGILDFSKITNGGIWLSCFMDLAHVSGIIVGADSLPETDPVIRSGNMTMASPYFIVFCPVGSQSEKAAKKYKIRYTSVGEDSVVFGIPFGEEPLGEHFYFYSRFIPADKPLNVRGTIKSSDTNQVVQTVEVPATADHVLFKWLDDGLRLEVLPLGEYDITVDVETEGSNGSFWTCASSHFSIVAMREKVWFDSVKPLPKGLYKEGDSFAAAGRLMANRPIQSVQVSLNYRVNDSHVEPIASNTVTPDPDTLSIPLADLLSPVMAFETLTPRKYNVTVTAVLEENLEFNFTSDFVIYNYDGLIDEDAARKIVQWCGTPANATVFDYGDYTTYLEKIDPYLNAAAIAACHYSDINRDNLINFLAGKSGSGYVVRLYKDAIYEMMKNLDVEVVTFKIPLKDYGDALKSFGKDMSTIGNITVDELVNSYEQYSEYLKAEQGVCQSEADAVTKLFFQEEFEYLSQLKKEIKGLKTGLTIIGYGQELVDLFARAQADYHRNMMAMASLCDAYGDNPPDEFIQALEEVMTEYTDEALTYISGVCRKLSEIISEKAMDLVVEEFLTGLSAIPIFSSISLTFSIAKFVGNKIATALLGDMVDRDLEFLSMMNLAIQNNQAYYRAFRDVQDGDTSSAALTKVYVAFNATQYAMDKLYDVMIEMAEAESDLSAVTRLQTIQTQINRYSIL